MPYALCGKRSAKQDVTTQLKMDFLQITFDFTDHRYISRVAAGSTTTTTTN